MASPEKRRRSATQLANFMKYAPKVVVAHRTADTILDGTSVGTLNITPGLQTAIEDDSAGGNTQVIVNAVPFRMFINGDQQTYKYQTDESVTYEFRLIEDI